ncbi:MAG TPA: AAA family ATPase [Nakamurella sp.]
MLAVTRRASSSRFIGRVEQIALFDDVLGDLVVLDGVGRGEVLLVGGEAGVGKTRLADEWSDRARLAGVAVVRGWCVEHGDDTMPLAPIADILRDVAAGASLEPDDVLGPKVDDLSRLVPDLDLRAEHPPSQSVKSMATLCDGVLRVLLGLSARRPLAVVLEDLHWSDASTRQLLMFLAPRVTRHRIALILTYRSDELHRRHPLRPFLASLRRVVRPEQIDLLPFTKDELTDLVAEVTGASPEPRVVGGLHDRCAGNAFFAEELLAGEALGRPSLVLRDAVLARTEGLGEDALTLLGTAAAAGARAGASVLAAASGLDPNRFAEAVEAVAAAGLCIQDGDRISFRHELAREIVEDEMLTGDRPGVHAALASAMQALTLHRMGEIARHWLLAGDRGAALQASVAAGRAATEIAADAEALTQFERALELWDMVPDPAMLAGCDHVDLLMDAADAAGRARLFGRAVALGRRGIAETASGNPDAEGAACLRMLTWAWFCLEDEDIARLIERAGRVVEDPPGGRTALALAWQAMLALSTREHDRTGVDVARPIARRAVELARAGGHVQAEALAEVTLGVCTCVERNPDGLREIRSALEKAKAGGFAMEAGWAYDDLAFYLSEFRRYDDVIDLEQEAIDYCTAAGIQRVQGVMIALSVIRALERRGRWQAVERRVEGLRADFGTLDIEHLTLADSWGLIRVRQGRLDHVQDLVDVTFSRMGDHRSVIGPTTVTAIELAAAGGSVAGVPDMVDSALDRILPRFAESAGAVVAAGIRALADFHGRSSTGAGLDDRQPLRHRADRWLDLVRQAQPPLVPPWMLTAEAERSRLDDSGETQWRAAVAAWRDLGAPYERAYTQWRLCETMLSGSERQSADTRAEARTMLVEARRIADELEAAPLREQIELLGARAHLSLDVIPRKPEGTGRNDQMGLTERESEVLRLVAQGYSNGQIGQALFISRKTASVHVSNILRKLGVSSRIEAATRSMHGESGGQF